MSGIYIHIPFCRQACHYCDFHFSTNLKQRKQMMEALATEIRQRKGYLDKPINTIYFGGGTPSLLSGDELQLLLETIDQTYEISTDPEITLEANPEDLTTVHSKALAGLGINRLSVGVQSFSDTALKWMNRIHNSEETIAAYANARAAGFRNISLDLIYALPTLSTNDWNNDLARITEMEPEHISIYGLTIEERTVFGKWKSQGKIEELAEERAAEQYEHLISYLKGKGYNQYEVSNFSKPGFESKHNAGYWSGKKYLGIGPGAHSFDQKSRSFNIRNNAKYIRLIEQNETTPEVEILTTAQQMNERILTSLRTIQGIDTQDFNSRYQVNLLDTYGTKLSQLRDQELVVLNSDSIALTTKGFLVADEIAMQLFFDE